MTEQKKKKIVLLMIKSRAKSAIEINRVNKKNVSKSGEKIKSYIIVPKMNYTP